MGPSLWELVGNTKDQSLQNTCVCPFRRDPQGPLPGPLCPPVQVGLVGTEFRPCQSGLAATRGRPRTACMSRRGRPRQWRPRLPPLLLVPGLRSPHSRHLRVTHARWPHLVPTQGGAGLSEVPQEALDSGAGAPHADGPGSESKRLILGTLTRPGRLTLLACGPAGVGARGE